MIPINGLVIIAESLAPKLEHLIPEDKRSELNKILESHKQDLENSVMEPKKATCWVTAFMALLFIILAVNYLIIPIINIFHPIKFLPLPDQLWTLMLVIIPSYLGFRSLDKHLDNIGNQSKNS